MSNNKRVSFTYRTHSGMMHHTPPVEVESFDSEHVVQAQDKSREVITGIRTPEILVFRDHQGRVEMYLYSSQVEAVIINYH